MISEKNDSVCKDSGLGIKDLLASRREAILRIAAKHGAHNVRVFGSVARGEAGENSDIDLLVELEQGRSLLDQAGLVLDLEELLGRKVDVVTEEGLYWLLRRRILKEARPL
jgi:predicted nucleotidyltransferase